MTGNNEGLYSDWGKITRERKVPENVLKPWMFIGVISMFTLKIVCSFVNAPFSTHAKLGWPWALGARLNYGR